MLQLLSYVAQTEREFIRQRQKEGIAAAKARGIKFGREPMQRPIAFQSVKKAWKEGEISARAASKQLELPIKLSSVGQKKVIPDKKVHFMYPKIGT